MDCNDMLHVFLFCVEKVMQATFSCTFNLFKSCMFQSLDDAGCSVGFRHPLNSIFKREGDLDYFNKFMQLLT